VFDIGTLAGTTELVGLTFVCITSTFVDDSADHINISRYING
jgi:hypothetical protein